MSDEKIKCELNNYLIPDLVNIIMEYNLQKLPYLNAIKDIFILEYDNNIWIKKCPIAYYICTKPERYNGSRELVGRKRKRRRNTISKKLFNKITNYYNLQ